jgi:polysaccharide export outer membrane protein
MLQRSQRRLYLWLVTALLFSGAISRADEKRAPTPAPVPSDYVLQPSDLLRVQVFQEEDLLREVRVTQEYSVTLPLIGVVDLKNKTLRQAQTLIRDLYDRDYLVNPQVNIIVLEYAKRTVNVLGSVNSPGAVLFPAEQGLTLLDAIARAGGFSRLADRKHVKLTRTNADGKAENVVINADEIIVGGTNHAWALQKDDVVFVPERVL